MFKQLFRKDIDKLTSLQKQLSASREQCERLETADPMTGMKNLKAAAEYVRELKDGMAGSLTVILINIDGLKEFNRQWGYQKGDRFIRCFGTAILECVPEEALSARISGGRFLVLLKGRGESELSGLGSLILSGIRSLDLKACLDIEGELRATVSLGTSFWDGSTAFDSDKLLRDAAAALDAARLNGGDQHIDYQAEQALFSRLQTDAAVQQELEKRMYAALESGDIFPVYQPQYDTVTGRICGVELLARWQYPQRGALCPAEFLPVFEKNRFVIDLDMFMFEQACRTIRDWLDRQMPVIPLSCNFSGQHFINPFWVPQLVEKTQRYQIPAAYIEIELSERTLIEYNNQLTEQIKRLRESGFVVVVDHFGLGYASLGLVQDISVDAVKLDQGILQKNMEKTDNRLILSGILYMAKMLHLQVRAVGVEAKEQEGVLQKSGCHIVQGNYYSEPVPLERLERLLDENRSRKQEKERMAYGVEQNRDFAEMIFQEFYIAQCMEHIQEHISEEITWSDVLHPDTVIGYEALGVYLLEEVIRHNFSFNMYSCTPHIAGQKVTMSGEGMLTEQVEEKLQDRRFCYFMDCEERGGKLVLLRFRMTAIIGDVAVNARRLELAMQRDADVRQGQAALEEFYGVLPIGIIRYDASEDMVITYINDHMLSIIGYTREEFFHGTLNGNIRRVVYPDDLELNYTTAFEMMAHTETPAFTLRYIRKDGKIVRVLYHQCMVTGAMGTQEVQSMIYEVPDDYEEGTGR